MRTLGIILIAAGILMMVFTGFNLVTKEKVVDLGPLEVNKTEKTPVNWSPILGVVLLISGTAIMLTTKRQNA